VQAGQRRGKGKGNKGGGGASGNSKGKGGKKEYKKQEWELHVTVPSVPFGGDPLAAMRGFQQHEKLLFDPLPASRGGDALQVVWAYPNTYTVGITSLGYQLVRSDPPPPKP
jgi:hypothetical protein